MVLSEELKDMMGTALANLPMEPFRHDPRCRELFLQILGETGNVAATVHAMHETGVLSAYIPEFFFARLFCLVRIDYYHRYTVDEHSIKTLELADSLVSGRSDQHQDLVNAAFGIDRRDLLYLALLLHDIGKGEGRGHVLRGGILSQIITQRMGLSKMDQEVVRQLVLLHLKMNHVSQRRDLEDPEVRDLRNGRCGWQRRNAPDALCSHIL